MPRSLRRLARATHAFGPVSPAAFNIMLPVEDVDSWYNRAIKAGCTAIMPPADMFWGDRYGQLREPFGVKWSIATPIRKS